MPEVRTRLQPRPYLITPRDAAEAVYGKAVLLTDTMIAQLLDLLQGQEALDDNTLEALWQKLMALWQESCPYEKDVPNN